MEKTIQYQHADKHVRTFVVGGRYRGSGLFQPFFQEIGGSKLTQFGGEPTSTEERAVHFAQRLLDKEMSGREYQRVADKGKGP